jgi:hypothetical protein
MIGASAGVRGALQRSPRCFGAVQGNPRFIQHLFRHRTLQYLQGLAASHAPRMAEGRPRRFANDY